MRRWLKILSIVLVLVLILAASTALWIHRTLTGSLPALDGELEVAVSPGHEEDGYFHMPGGQSGHPMAAHYRAGHEAWTRGDRTPLSPGPTQHELKLLPRDDSGP